MGNSFQKRTLRRIFWLGLFLFCLGSRDIAYALEQVVAFTHTLVPGSSGEEVRDVQKYLSQFPDLYPEGKVTGFFGPATEQAVRRFQTRYGINPLGIVGPATREKLNSFQPAVLGASTTGASPMVSSEFLTRQIDNIIDTARKRVESASIVLGEHISDLSTDDLEEGQTNIFYRDSLVNSFVSASTTIPKLYNSNTFTGSNTFSGGSTFSGAFSLGSFNGPLQANAGTVSATSAIGVLYGGTGLTSAPNYGQISIGNASGGYTLTATSSLKINADDMIQGLTNMFYSNTLVNGFVHGSSTIPKLYTSNTFTGTNIFPSDSVTIGSLNGPLHANAGVISATSTLTVLYGGTGLTSAGSLGNILRSNGTGFVSTAVTTSQSTPADPSTTTNTTGVMMGLAASITPIRSGIIMIIISGDADNNTIADGVQAQIRYGTGSAPANGGALTGTTAGSLVKMLNPNLALLTVGRSTFSLNAIVTGLTPSTAYWIDIGVAAITGGTARVRDVSVSVVEL